MEKLSVEQIKQLDNEDTLKYIRKSCFEWFGIRPCNEHSESYIILEKEQLSPVYPYFNLVIYKEHFNDLVDLGKAFVENDRAIAMLTRSAVGVSAAKTIYKQLFVSEKIAKLVIDDPKGTRLNPFKVFLEIVGAQSFNNLLVKYKTFNTEEDVKEFCSKMKQLSNKDENVDILQEYLNFKPKEASENVLSIGDFDDFSDDEDDSDNDGLEENDDDDDDDDEDGSMVEISSNIKDEDEDDEFNFDEDNIDDIVDTEDNTTLEAVGIRGDKKELENKDTKIDEEKDLIFDKVKESKENLNHEINTNETNEPYMYNVNIEELAELTANKILDKLKENNEIEELKSNIKNLLIKISSTNFSEDTYLVKEEVNIYVEKLISKYPELSNIMNNYISLYNDTDEDIVCMISDELKLVKSYIS